MSVLPAPREEHDTGAHGSLREQRPGSVYLRRLSIELSRSGGAGGGGGDLRPQAGRILEDARSTVRQPELSRGADLRKTGGRSEAANPRVPQVPSRSEGAG